MIVRFFLSLLVLLFAGCRPDRPVYEAAVTPLQGATSGTNFGFVEFIRSPYGVIANLNLIYVEPGSYNVAVTDRARCESGNFSFPEAVTEADLGTVRVDASGVLEISTILTEYDRSDFEPKVLYGRCVEVRSVSGAMADEGSSLVILGRIGPETGTPASS